MSDQRRSTRRQRVTLKQIAERAGVHPATVSRALNPETAAMLSRETKERVLNVADELGYRPTVAARTLREGHSSLIGIVVANLENPYTAQIIRGVENALEGRGIMALVAETQDDHDRMSRAVTNLLGRDVDGIVCTGARANSARLLRKAYDEVPVVLVDRTLRGAGIPTVAPDDRRAGRLAAEHLLGLGHRRVAQLAGASDISSFEVRSHGFREAVVTLGQELVEIGDTAVEPSVDEGRRMAENLLKSQNRPSAVFAHNDLLALGALAALRNRGLHCPEDLSVIGCDDLPFTEYTTPPLTTVKLPGYQLGRIAAEMLVAMAENPAHTPANLTVTPTVTVRESTSEPSS